MAVKTNRRKRIKMGIRKNLEGTTLRPRLSVFRSNKGIYAQLIDDSKGHTIVAASSSEIDEKARLKQKAADRFSDRYPGFGLIPDS